MFPRVPAAIPLALLVVLAGCQGEGDDLLSSPASANAPTIEAACNSAPEICDLIEALFPEPGLENAVLTQFGNIARQLERGETADAVDMTLNKIVFEIGHYENGRLEDPAGNDPPTIEEALTELLNAELEFVGLTGNFPDPDEGGLGDEDFAWQICEPGVKCVFETESDFAGFSGTFTERTLVTIFRLPDDTFEAFDVVGFPLIFDFSATSLSDGMGPAAGLTLASLAEPATVAVCAVDPPDPEAPPEEVLPFLALGHVIEGDEGPEVEILPDAPPGDFALDCEGASSTPPPVIGSLGWWGEHLASAFEPLSDYVVSQLLANPGERRGLITAFSPVGAVDTRTVGDDEEGGPTTTTLTLNGQSTNVSISHGQTATAMAVVDPAPGNELEPSVQFIFSQFSGGPGPPTSTQSLDDGEASVPVLCDALGTLTPPPGTVEITASRFVRAVFSGAGDFEPSTSNTLILGCSAPIG
ncbi:MAG: Ig-like domain-containing protein [Gemmatimonadota bacterium]